MSVYKDEKRNSWYFAVNYNDLFGNRKQKRKRGFKTKKEAVNAEREFLNFLNNGTMEQSESTISEIIDVYLKDKENLVKGSTFKSIYGILKNRVDYYLGNIKVNELKNTHIIRFHDFLLNPPEDSPFRKISNSTAQETHSVFIAMLKYAEKHYNVTPISYKFTPPKQFNIESELKNEKMCFYTLEQFEVLHTKMLENNDFLIADIISMLFYTGMRVGELAALTYNHISLEDKKVLIRQNIITVKNGDKFTEKISTPKTKTSVRNITLPDRAVKILERHLKEDTSSNNFSKEWFIFSPFKVTHYKLTTLRHHYDKAFLKTDMPKIKMHDFRHSHVSLLINSGANAMLVKERLGHASVTTTLDTYAHFFPEKEDEILLCLNNLLP